jgi:hypothetical protein
MEHKTANNQSTLQSTFGLILHTANVRDINLRLASPTSILRTQFAHKNQTTIDGQGKKASPR